MRDILILYGIAVGNGAIALGMIAWTAMVRRTAARWRARALEAEASFIAEANEGTFWRKSADFERRRAQGYLNRLARHGLLTAAESHDYYGSRAALSNASQRQKREAA